MRIMNERLRDIAMSRIERRRHIAQLLVPHADHFTFVLHTPLPVIQRQRRKVNRRHAQEQKVPRASIIDLVKQPTVHGKDLIVQGRRVLQPPRVAYIVDADEKGVEGVGSRPWCGRIGWCTIGWNVLVLDLVLKGEHSGFIGGDEGGVDGCATVCYVVGENFAGIVGCCKKADPIGTASGRLTGSIWGRGL